MINDNEGFCYPIVDESICINCNLCCKVCPQINSKDTEKSFDVYALSHPDSNILIKSSSGGAFSLLAEWVLLNNGIVFGAAFDENWDVKHIYIDKISDLDKLRRSKYVQSNINDSFRKTKEFLLKDKLVLFTGTPCQIKGLKLYLNKEYDKLITVDLICHGVPSPMIWLNYIKRISFLKGKNIKDINFRAKDKGWELFSLKISNDNNSCFSENLLINPYLRGFIRNIYLRPSCYKCNSKSFKSGSDFTIGDFWGVKEEYPALYNRDGVSCISVNSEKAKEYFESMNIKCTKVDYISIYKYNHALEESVSMPKFRNLFFKLYPYTNFKFLVFFILLINKIYRILRVGQKH